MRGYYEERLPQHVIDAHEEAVNELADLREEEEMDEIWEDMVREALNEKVEKTARRVLAEVREENAEKLREAYRQEVEDRWANITDNREGMWIHQYKAPCSSCLCKSNGFKI